MDRFVQIPRLLIAGTSSGVGKTTVVVGMIKALRDRGLKVSVFKCGPDYLDPTYHAISAGVPSPNLDGWLMGRDAVLNTFITASEGTDIAIIEGVMGLFDGASPRGEEGSSAEIAKWLSCPVLVVVDASGMARSIGAVAHGFSGFDRGLNVTGLICNRVGSRGHLELLCQSVDTPPIVGGLPVTSDLSFPERHLGLVTASREVLSEKVLTGWGSQVTDWFKMDRILQIARDVPSLSVKGCEEDKKRGSCRIGIAHDGAFHFYYEDNLRRLEQLGAELVRFSPVYDSNLPDVDGIYVGGGYPELYARELSGNRSMIGGFLAFASSGRPIYAECGGLMYLTSGIKTLDGQWHKMVGLIPAKTVMSERLKALGYVEVETQRPSLFGPAGLRFRGHQFRYSELEDLAEVDWSYTVRRRRGGSVQKEGYSVGNVLASYVHAHWASNPLVAEGFVDACIKARGRI